MLRFLFLIFQFSLGVYDFAAYPDVFADRRGCP
jgi:hypothetical protein